MDTISIELPSEVVQAIPLPEQEIPKRVRLELAVALYAQELLSLGKAAELAAMPRLAFNDLLAARGIMMHYGEKELAADLAYAKRGQ